MLNNDKSDIYAVIRSYNFTDEVEAFYVDSWYEGQQLLEYLARAEVREEEDNAHRPADLEISVDRDFARVRSISDYDETNLDTYYNLTTLKRMCRKELN